MTTPGPPPEESAAGVPAYPPSPYPPSPHPPQAWPPQPPATPPYATHGNPPGYPPGYPPQGYPPQGYPPGYPPQGYPLGHPAFPPTQPVRRRPSAWWFAPGAVALVVAVTLGGYAGFVIAGLAHTDGYVGAGAGTRAVALGHPGRHMLFVRRGAAAPACVVGENGSALALQQEAANDSIDLDTGSWLPFASFSSAGTQVTIRCEGAVGWVRVGAAAGAPEYTRIGVAVIGGLALGLAGLVASIVVAVLFFMRPSRRVTG